MKCLVVKASGECERRDMEPTLANLQAAVGGYVEEIGLRQQFRPACAFINEDGKRMELPFNQKATKIVRPLHGDCIVGDMLVCGPCDADGYPSDLDDATVAAINAAFRRSQTYHVAITLTEPDDASELYLPNEAGMESILANSTVVEALAEATGCDVTITLD